MPSPSRGHSLRVANSSRKGNLLPGLAGPSCHGHRVVFAWASSYKMLSGTRAVWGVDSPLLHPMRMAANPTARTTPMIPREPNETCLRCLLSRWISSGASSRIPSSSYFRRRSSPDRSMPSLQSQSAIGRDQLFQASAQSCSRVTVSLTSSGSLREPISSCPIVSASWTTWKRFLRKQSSFLTRRISNTTQGPVWRRKAEVWGASST